MWRHERKLEKTLKSTKTHHATFNATIFSCLYIASFVCACFRLVCAGVDKAVNNTITGHDAMQHLKMETGFKVTHMRSFSC